VKTKVTKFRRGIAEGAGGAEELVVTAISALDRAVSKGVLHRNNAARRKARLMKRLNASAAAPAPAPAAPIRGAKGASSSKTASSAKAASAAKGTTRSKSASKR
jgi:hypothetical protein